MSVQTQIVAAAGQNGDLDGCDDDELLARQVMHLAEKLGVLASTVEVSDPVLAAFLGALVSTGNQARRLLRERPHCVTGANVHSVEAVRVLAAIGLHVSIAAHALAIADIMQAAHRLAFDIARQKLR